MEKHSNSSNVQFTTEPENGLKKISESNITTIILCLSAFCEYTDYDDEYDICRNIIEWIYSKNLNNIDDLFNLMPDDMYSRLISFLDDFVAYSNGLTIECKSVQKHLSTLKKTTLTKEKKINIVI